MERRIIAKIYPSSKHPGRLILKDAEGSAENLEIQISDAIKSLEGMGNHSGHVRLALKTIWTDED